MRAARASHCLATAAALAFVVPSLSCLRLDGFYYNPEPAPAGGYDLTLCPIDDSTQPPVGDIIPEDAIEVVTLDVAGETIDARFVRAGGLASATVLYSHGQLANLCKYWGRAYLLWALGYNVLIYDYEGFGASTGDPSEEALYRDVRAALQHLRERSDVDPERIVYYGFSLGGAAAIDLAVDEPPAALITEAAFASTSDFASDSSGLDLVGGFIARAEFDNIGKVPLLESPYLVLHGTADDFVRFGYGEQLYEAAPEPKRLYAAEGAGHSTVPFVDESAYIDEVSGWIDLYAP